MVRNNRFFLDTHVFIWWMEENKRLSNDIWDLLYSPQNLIFLSVASVWEVIIKKAKGKLNLPKDIEGGIIASGFTVLPIQIPHVLAVEKLPFHHKDPIDRLLVAQAMVENLTILTDDKKFGKYRVETFN